MSINDASMKVPIKVVTFSCTVNSVGFKSSSISVDYQIGAGLVQEDLPAIEQKPDCGLPFNQIVIKSITSNLAEDVIAAAITVDTDLAAVIIATDDVTLDGEQVSIVLAIDVTDAKNAIEAKELFFDIEFNAKPPEFDMSDFSVEPLTCGPSDSEWTMTLPIIKNAEEGQVTLELLDSDEFSPIFIHSGSTVALETQAKEDLAAGAYCPATTDITLVFRLTHVLFGDFEQSLSVPVQPQTDDEQEAEIDEESTELDESSSSETNDQVRNVDTSKYKIT